MERFTRSALQACARKLRELCLAYQYGMVVLRSLVYNSAVGEDYVLELFFQPIYCLVDAVVPWFGKALVAMVALLTLSVVLIMYGVVYPAVLPGVSVWRIAFHLCYGHWNLALISFHYYKAVSTDPGWPSQGSYNRASEASLCKKCLQYRPPRAHHCRICCRCVLKMDHHCYWMDNCVGHFNHRYFLSFCVSMTLGCIYCSATTWDLVILGDPAMANASDLLDPFRRNWIIYIWVMCRYSGTAMIMGRVETGSCFWESIARGTGPHACCCHPPTFPLAMVSCGTRDPGVCGRARRRRRVEHVIPVCGRARRRCRVEHVIPVCVGECGDGAVWNTCRRVTVRSMMEQFGRRGSGVSWHARCPCTDFYCLRQRHPASPTFQRQCLPICQRQAGTQQPLHRSVA